MRAIVNRILSDRPTDFSIESLANVLNGGIEDDNISPEANISLSKINISSLVPSGTIFPYGGTVAPSGWVLCNGAEYDTTGEYASLYKAIGTSFGSSGSGKFNVPDTRGRFLRGVDKGAGNDPDRATRTASNVGGNTGDAVGSVQTDGFKSHTHTQDQHRHAQNVVVASGGAFSYWSWTNNGMTESGTGVNTQYTTATNQNTGGNETRPINLYVEYIIKL